MNTRIFLFLSCFFVMFSSGQAQDSIIVKSFVDTLHIARQDSLIKNIKEILAKKDSLPYNTIVGDTIAIDTLAVDSLSMDSLSLDSLVMDSLALDSVAMDSAMTDTIVPVPKIQEKKPVKVRLSVVDSLSLVYTYRMEQLKKEYKKFKYTGSDTLANPYYFYIFAPPAYYVMPMHQMIGVLSPSILDKDEEPQPRLRPEGTVVPTDLLRSMETALSSVYATSPQFITQNEEVDLGVSGLRKDVNHEVKPSIKLAEKVSDSADKMVDDYKTDDWNIVVHRPNFWNFKANVAFQIMQYFYSDNWYKGGENHYSWLASSVLEANYNNKQKVTFDNKLEMRLGFQSSKGDSKHKFRSNSDQVRLTNKLGLRAAKHWYYTLMLQSWTQFYPSYKKNDPKVYSDFMSPFESIISIGMDYKLNLKKFNMSATISPFAGNFKYVDRKDLSPSFGVDKDKHSKFDFGSNITIRYNWNIVKNVSWSGRIFYFTDYETTRVEWENTFNLVINKFLSTKVYIYPRFDDGVQRKEDQSYFQFHENLSLGFNYNF